ncbi:MAG TPA: 50S ribosomal protein L19 [Candidatus Humimicrobiaceae bacterium]|nr:50S ribosomal protein L19 [Candidatus Humimicrobiaceae bacterium]
MTTKTEKFLKPFLKEGLPDIRPGDTVRVYQKIKEGEKEKVQAFEGQVLARKHGKEIGATITVRREISGIGTEKIFPLHSPIIEKIEILKRGKVRRAKLYYLRKVKGKGAKLKSSDEEISLEDREK